MSLPRAGYVDPVWLFKRNKGSSIKDRKGLGLGGRSGKEDSSRIPLGRGIEV